jgi:hypothetical protein
MALLKVAVAYTFTSGTYGVSYALSAWGVSRARCLRSPVTQSTMAECEVTLLSHATTVLGAQRTRAW